MQNKCKYITVSFEALLAAEMIKCQNAHIQKAFLKPSGKTTEKTVNHSVSSDTIHFVHDYRFTLVK